MKKDNVLLAILIVIFVVYAAGVIFGPILLNLKSDNSYTQSIVYSDEYKESVRKNVIYELYGSREAYASEKTGSRSDYVDREASKDGNLVIDEKRMQQVYDSKLKEFDTMIDYEKVDKIVSERLEKMVEEGKYNDLAQTNEVTNKKVMYWSSGGKYYALVILAAMIAYIIYKKRKEQ